MSKNLATRVQLGSFEVDLSAGELRNGNATVVLLPDQPLQLLRMLIEAEGEIVSREQIEKRLWSSDTVVEFDSGINSAVKKLRRALGDSGDEPRYIETISKRGYRLLVPVERPAVITSAPQEHDQKPAVEQSIQSGEGELRAGFRWKWLVTGAAVCIIIIISGELYLHSHSRPKLTERDTIVLGDFDNTTGDPLYDDTLKQGLAVQLSQSPFLDLMSDRKVDRILSKMGRQPGDRLTPEVTREVCLRANSKAMVNGAIAALGSEYVIALRAVDCNSGNLLAKTQEQAETRESVLRALDDAASSLRSKLGESIGSVRKNDRPLVEDTTASLEALKAYSLGQKMDFVQGPTASLSFYKRAVELDPNFAMAYSSMTAVYSALNEVGRASENARLAYEHREKVSERERFAIEVAYYLTRTGELERAAQTAELWQKTYPRDPGPRESLAFIDAGLGRIDRVLEEALDAARLQPNEVNSYINLGGAYQNLNRLDEAEAAYKQAEQRSLNSLMLLANRYELAFLKGDSALMAQSASAAMGKPSIEDALLSAQADTEGWHGRLKNARAQTRRAMDSARQNDAKETAATYQASEALEQVETGYRAEALADADAALKLAPNRDVKAMAALAIARAGNTKGAEKLYAELESAFPLDTLVQRYWLPVIGAAVAVQKNDPNHAIELLDKASGIELSQPTQGVVFLCPVYLRGEAYLMLHDGKAVTEFQKFIDRRGLVVNFPWGALARLGLARAYALDASTDPADREKARAAYQDFLTLWRNADPDIPIYKQAKAEYAKLQ
jgi:eukaryotic-like serine/threonine-protein kinase